MGPFGAEVVAVCDLSLADQTNSATSKSGSEEAMYEGFSSLALRFRVGGVKPLKPGVRGGSSRRSGGAVGVHGRGEDTGTALAAQDKLTPRFPAPGPLGAAMLAHRPICRLGRSYAAETMPGGMILLVKASTSAYNPAGRTLQSGRCRQGNAEPAPAEPSRRRSPRELRLPTVVTFPPA